MYKRSNDNRYYFEVSSVPDVVKVMDMIVASSE